MIKRITLTNFKGYESFNFEPKETNILEGMNGVGKTSIIEAITVAYYGRLPDGGSDLGSLVNNKYESATILIVDDKIGTICRTIGKKSPTKLTIDGKSITQSNFENEYRLVPIKYFLPAVNPGYWLNIDYKARREIMVDLSPKIDSVEVFKELYSQDSKMVDLFMSTTYQESNRKVKDLQSTLDNNRGRLMQVENEIIPLNEVYWNDENQKELDRLLSKYNLNEKTNAKRESLLVRLSSVKDNQTELQTLQNKQSELKNELVGLKGKYPSLARFTKASEVTDLLNELDQLIESKVNIELRLENLHVKAVGLTTGKDTTCPTCGQQLDVKKIEAEKTLTLAEIDKLNGEFTQVINKIAELNIVKTQYNDYSKVKSEYQSKLTNLEYQINRLNDSVKLGDDLQKELSQVESLLKQDDYTFNDAIDGTDLTLLTEQKQQFKTYQEIKQNQQQNNEKTKESINKIIELTETELKDMELLSEALSPKGVYSEVVRRQAKGFESEVKKFSSDLSIETLEPLKSDPTRFSEVFNVIVGDRNESQLSTGQRMVIASSFTGAIRKLVNQKYNSNVDMLFVDNASLVTSHSHFDSVAEGLQKFYCVNTKYKEIKVTSK